MAQAGRRVRALLNRIITSLAWLVADWTGWRVATAVYPAALRGATAIVSGANAGLGLEDAKALLQQGATVVMACRSLEHAHSVREDILADRRNWGPVPDPHSRLVVLHLDLEDFSSIRRFVDEFRACKLPGLRVLLNNAGVHLKEHKHVDCRFERTRASDYFGHVYLTELLLSDLKANAPSRVINVASVAEMLGPVLYTRTLPWDDLRGARLDNSGEEAYVQAKTMLLMATRELARRLEGTGVDVIAVHPGIADSTWYLKSDDAYTFSWIISRVRSVFPCLGCGQPVGAGAISSIKAAIDPELTGITSDPASRGIVDTIARALLGGRLIYLGPLYLSNVFVVNLFNAGRRWVVNPWCYNKAACHRLYAATKELINEVEAELGLTPSRQPAVDGGSAANGAAAANGGGLGGAQHLKAA